MRRNLSAWIVAGVLVGLGCASLACAVENDVAAVSLFQKGERLRMGSDGAIDLKAALPVFKEAAELGHAKACARVGELYFQGFSLDLASVAYRDTKELERDFKEAAGWF